MVKKETLQDERYISHMISCSHTFAFRSRCGFCKTGPKYYYSQADRMYLKFPIGSLKYFSNEISYRFKMIGADKSRDINPSLLSVKNRMCKFGPKSHSINKKYKKISISEIIYCECGKTTWSMPLIIDSERKSRYCRINAPAKLKND